MARRNLFHQANGLHGPLFIACSDDGLNAGPHSAPVSVAGLGARGPFGPRTGSSSGVLPGNSCGCGGWPGSRIGGGTSGRGLPGGASGGGSVGCPGVAGGIFRRFDRHHIETLRFSPMSGRVPSRGGCGHLHIADDGAGQVPNSAIVGGDLQDANVGSLGAVPPAFAGGGKQLFDLARGRWNGHGARDGDVFLAASSANDRFDGADCRRFPHPCDAAHRSGKGSRWYPAPDRRSSALREACRRRGNEHRRSRSSHRRQSQRS